MVIITFETKTIDEVRDITLFSSFKEVQIFGKLTTQQAMIITSNCNWETVIFNIDMNISDIDVVLYLSKNRFWRFVYFDFCIGFQDIDIEYISQNSSWEHLHITNTKLTPTGCKLLSTNKSWFMVDLYCTHLGDKHIQQLLQNISWKFVNLTGNVDIGNTVFQSIFDHMKSKSWLRVFIWTNRQLDETTIDNCSDMIALGHYFDDNRLIPC